LKIAFITHTTIIGGAALSSSKAIQFLLDNGLLQPEKCLLIQPKYRDPSNEKNDAYFNVKKSIKKVYEFKLPFSPIFKGTTSNYIIKIYYLYNEFFALISYIFYYNKIIRREKITVVHLNSIVLWPLLLVLPKSVKIVIHIREVLINSIEARIAIFVINRHATKIISIDRISDIPFSKSGKSIVISNPYNMTASRQLRPSKKSIKLELGIPQESFVVSLFGQIGEQKGFDFLLKIINLSTQIKNLVFLIIGKPVGRYGDKCIQLLNTFSNVKCVGEQNDTSKFYAITDVVIRCEDYLPLGRTVWEGIFAGGIALVPVNKNDDISVIQEYIGKYIFTYQALNVDNCIEILKEIMKKYPDTVFETGYPVSDNTSISAEQFFEVIRS